MALIKLPPRGIVGCWSQLKRYDWTCGSCLGYDTRDDNIIWHGETTSGIVSIYFWDWWLVRQGEGVGRGGTRIPR